MGLIKCPVCGEKFADTYKRCPFCEEDDNPRKVKQPRRYNAEGRRIKRSDELPRVVYYDDEEEEYRPRRKSAEEAEDRKEDPEYRGRRSRDDYDDDYDDDDDYYDDDDDRGSPHFKIVLAILIAIIILCVLYLGRGMIANLFDGGNEDKRPSSSMVSDDQPSVDDPDIIIPGPDDSNHDDDQNQDDPVVDDPPVADDPVVDPPDEPDPPVVSGDLKLSHTDVTLAGDEKFTLKATNATDAVTYSSKDSSIATVSASGVVTGVSVGRTEIIVQSGTKASVCLVRVKSNGTAGGSETSSDQNTAATAFTLNKSDITISVGEVCMLKTGNANADLTWHVEDLDVATVDGSGKVVGVSKGKTTVTAKWGDYKASCVVRVK